MRAPPSSSPTARLPRLQLAERQAQGLSVVECRSGAEREGGQRNLYYHVVLSGSGGGGGGGGKAPLLQRK